MYLQRLFEFLFVCFNCGIIWIESFKILSIYSQSQKWGFKISELTKISHGAIVIEAK
jgi:hypothetical protein